MLPWVAPPTPVSTGRLARCELCCGHNRPSLLPIPLSNKVGPRGGCCISCLACLSQRWAFGGSVEGQWRSSRKWRDGKDGNSPVGKGGENIAISSEPLLRSGPPPPPPFHGFTVTRLGVMAGVASLEPWWDLMGLVNPVSPCPSSFQCPLGSSAPILPLLNPPFLGPSRTTTAYHCPPEGNEIFGV